MLGVRLTELQLVVANCLDHSSQNSGRGRASRRGPPERAIEVFGANPKLEGKRSVENLWGEHVGRLVDVDCAYDDEIARDRPLLAVLGVDPLASDELQGGDDRLRDSSSTKTYGADGSACARKMNSSVLGTDQTARS